MWGGFELRNQICHCKTVCIKRNLYLINYNLMRTQWNIKGNRDAGSSCLCDRGLHRYLRNFGGVEHPKPPSPRYATEPCPEEYSNPRPECSSGVMAYVTQSLRSPNFRTYFLCIHYYNTKFSCKFFRFSRRLLISWWSSVRFLYRVADVCSDSSQERTASIFRVRWRQ